MKILLVEDDERIAQALAESLKDHQYLVDLASDGEMGWDYVEIYSYDLILLDVMLPKLNGIDFCRKLRRSGRMTPVLMLTARDTSNDKVIGLDAGADDYVIKPFDLPELTARIRALLRRGNPTTKPVLEWENLRLDPSSCEVTYLEKQVHLTPKQYGLLELFLRNNHLVLSRSAIIDNLWSSSEDPPSEEAVKVHLKDLRTKLRTAGAPPDLIETVYGLGYRLKQHPC